MTYNVFGGTLNLTQSNPAHVFYQYILPVVSHIKHCILC